MSKQPADAEYAERVAGAGGRRRTVRRTQGLVALAASVAVVAGGLAGLNRLLSDDAPDSSSDPAINPSAPPATVVTGPLVVSGSGVGTQPFGTDADEVLAAVAARFGEPDLTVGPQRYFRIPGSNAWYEAADDPLSPSWPYPITSVTCWDTLCLILGGDAADTLQLRGWELAQRRRWSGFEERKTLHSPAVLLARTGIGLGDSSQHLVGVSPEGLRSNTGAGHVQTAGDDRCRRSTGVARGVRRRVGSVVREEPVQPGQPAGHHRHGSGQRDEALCPTDRAALPASTHDKLGVVRVSGLIAHPILLFPHPVRRWRGLSGCFPSSSVSARRSSSGHVWHVSVAVAAQSPASYRHQSAT